MLNPTYPQPGHTRTHEASHRQRGHNTHNDETTDPTNSRATRYSTLNDTMISVIPCSHVKAGRRTQRSTKTNTRHTHDPHDEQTGAKDDEKTETDRNGITTKTIRLDTIGTIHRGCHDANRAHYEPRMTNRTKATMRQTSVEVTRSE